MNDAADQADRVDDRKQASSSAGLFLACFGALFLLPGVFMIVAWSMGEMRDGDGPEWMPLVAAAIFVLGGGSVSLTGVILWAKDAWARAAQARHPGQPWRWRREWERNALQSRSGSTAVVTGLFTLVWLAFCVPIIWAMFIDTSKHPPAMFRAIFGVGFPLIGFYLLLSFLHRCWQGMRYGGSVLRLASVPGVIGGELAGYIGCSLPARHEPVFHVQLRCVRRTAVRRGKHTRVDEQVLWSKGYRTLGEAAADHHGATRVPVRFALPDGLPASGDEGGSSSSSSGSSSVSWVLDCSSQVPGVDFSATFEVPAFPLQADDRPASRVQVIPLPPGTRGASRVTLEEDGDRLRVRFPPMLNPAAAQIPVAIGVPAGCMAWWGWAEGSVVGSAIAALVAAMCAYGWARAWFLITVIEVAEGTVVVRKRLLLASWERRFEPGVVTGVSTQASWQETGATAGGRSFSKLKLAISGGRDVGVGSAMHRRDEAEQVRAAIAARLVSAGARPASAQG